MLFPVGGRSSVGRASDCGSECRGFKSHRPPQNPRKNSHQFHQRRVPTVFCGLQQEQTKQLTSKPSGTPHEVRNDRGFSCLQILKLLDVARYSERISCGYFRWNFAKEKCCCTTSSLTRDRKIGCGARRCRLRAGRRAGGSAFHSSRHIDLLSLATLLSRWYSTRDCHTRYWPGTGPVSSSVERS